VGERSNPLCDGTRAERRHDERSGPGEKTPAPSRGAQSGNNLKLVFARRRELSANFSEAFFVLPRQYPLSGVGRTFASPALVTIHDLNARAATLGAVGTASGGESGNLANARSRLVSEAISEDSGEVLQSPRPTSVQWSSGAACEDHGLGRRIGINGGPTALDGGARTRRESARPRRGLGDAA
jgi:hypothetical protein